ncbi:adhesion G protein-coupled receptor A1 isoform X1, partial [Clarias magur]
MMQEELYSTWLTYLPPHKADLHVRISVSCSFWVSLLSLSLSACVLSNAPSTLSHVVCVLSARISTVHADCSAKLHIEAHVTDQTHSHFAEAKDVLGDIGDIRIKR